MQILCKITNWNRNWKTITEITLSSMSVVNAVDWCSDDKPQATCTLQVDISLIAAENAGASEIHTSEDELACSWRRSLMRCRTALEVTLNWLPLTVTGHPPLTHTHTYTHTARHTHRQIHKHTDTHAPTSCAGGRHHMPPPPASWSLNFSPWKWCPCHVWRGLPLYQF